MKNPQTTVTGIIGLVGSIMATVGVYFANKPWGQTVATIGILLTGGNGVGNIVAKDANK